VEDVERGLVFHPGLHGELGEVVDDAADIVPCELDRDRAVLGLVNEDRCAGLHPEPITERLRNHDLTLRPDLGENRPTGLERHNASMLV
jgi:hypothetical protein